MHDTVPPGFGILFGPARFGTEDIEFGSGVLGGGNALAAVPIEDGELYRGTANIKTKK
jgi:hypothetical protein